MKKILAVLLAVALVVTLSFSAVMMASATDDPTIVVASVTAKKGETKDITISLVNNPGLASMKLSVTYPAGLSLVSLGYDEDAECDIWVNFNILEKNGQATQPQKADSPVIINWVSPLANVKGDVVFATLTFKVDDDAEEGDKPITVSYNPEDVYNKAENNIAFGIEDGKITVVSCLHDGAKTNHPAVASTCKTAGHEAYTTCDLCGAVVSGDNTPLPLDPTNHEGGTEVRDAATATCTAAGYTGDTYCLGCGEKIADGESIAMVAHTLGEWLHNPEEHWKVCSECEGKFDLGYHDYNKVVTPATCTEGGYTTYTCKVCGYSFTGDNTDPLNHTGGTANCHSGAICTRCGEAYGDKDPSNHDGGTEIKGYVAPTTEAEGYTGDTVCKGCGETLEKGEPIAKLIAYESEQTAGKTVDEKPTYDATASAAIGVTAKFAKAKLTGVKVNGEVISEDKYDVTEDDEGNTVVTLKEDYLKSLGNGNYTLTVVADDGIAENSFAVVNNTVTGDTSATTTTNGSPKTGDMDMAIIVIALLGVMAASMFAGFTYRRKNED